MSNHDRSHKDGKYFLTGDTFNCPFCSRRNVRYTVKSHGSFNWDHKRQVHFYRVACSDCGKISFHLSNYLLEQTNSNTFVEPPKSISYVKNDLPTLGSGVTKVTNEIKSSKGEPAEFDDLFFFHQPTSFFTVDGRIPTAIREPLSEAENCLKNNFLTGASAGLRKAIYKLLKYEKVPVQNEAGDFLPYSDRIKLLAQKHSSIEQDLFHDLEVIQGLTSQELHENDWEDFDASTVRFLLEVSRQLLNEIYILPEERKQRRQKIVNLKQAAKPMKHSIDE